MVSTWRAVKIPNCIDALATLKPTAVVLSADGSVTDPVVKLRAAPEPMNKLALVMATESRSPFRVSVPTATPDTSPRPTLTVALPKTTSAMLRPTEPPIWNVGSVAASDTAAAASGLPESLTNALPCFQSITAVPAETRFSERESPEPIIFTASTPWRRADPKAPFRPVYLRTSASVSGA